MVDGMLDLDGGFFLGMSIDSSTAGVHLLIDLTLSDDATTARIGGRISWNAEINYGAGTVSGKAIAEITGGVEIGFDGDEPRWSGSVSTHGRLVYQNRDLFQGTVETFVRSMGFRFRFPARSFYLRKVVRNPFCSLRPHEQWP